MIKTISLLLILLTNVSLSFADDTVRLFAATQTYFCEMSDQMNCKAVNQPQQKEILLNKNGGNVRIEDKEHKLSANAYVSMENTNVAYEMTLCSEQVCSVSVMITDSTGTITQSMSGQYNLTQKSFYVLLFFITTNIQKTNNLNILKLPKLYTIY
jgi:hypothetical protein